MNKRLIASVSCAALLLSSTSLAANTNSIKTAVDAVATATTAAPAPSTPATPSTPSTPATPAKPTTPTPVVANATEITRLLALNSVGGDVSLLQALLISNGYVLKVDGIYGVKTLAAVESFQGKNGLRVDGIVGPKTLAKLAPVVAEVVDPEKPATPVEPEKPVEEVVPVTPVEPVEEEVVDAVTSASLVNNETDFEKGIAKDGRWIISTLNDLTFDKTIILDGDFINNRDAVQRKIALYTQDDNKVVLERFTLTAPKLIIISPEARIQGGTFKGDVHVTVKNFQLVDAKVDGNIYFTTQEAMDTFKMDDKSSLSGVKELLVVDAVTSASLVNNETDFEKGIAKDGRWIISTLNDLTFDKTIILDGDFINNRDAVQRKIALYTQDDDKVVTARFTLTAPKLTILSPEARIQGGTFKGDVYVSVENFQLVDAKVEGNIYFTTQEAMDTFKMDAKSSVTGVQELKAE